MKKFEEEFDYLIRLFGKTLIGQIEVEEFEKHREIFLKKYSEKQQPEIPEVPQFVAEWIKKLKHKKREPLENPITFGESLPGLTDKDLEKAFNWIRANQETYMVAWLNGYTVKEKRFYLKFNKQLFNPENGNTVYSDLYLDDEGALITDKNYAKKFTLQEIENMNNGSFELIEVK